MSQIEGDAASYGLYVQPSASSDATSASGPLPVPQRQAGVFRINCVDCLDRTNVVQVGGLCWAGRVAGFAGVAGWQGW